MKTETRAIECVLARLFDYAGMFPPAKLDARTALDAYREHRSGAHAWALGNLVVDVRALRALQTDAMDLLRGVRLSVVAQGSELGLLYSFLDQGLPIDMVELKTENGDEVEPWKKSLPASVATYVEVPVGKIDARLLDAIGAAGVRAKLRLGGAVAGAFPAASVVAATLKQLAARRIAFKATAGLHHPLRSHHSLTYEPGSPSGWMHGFVNLLCASANVWFGGKPKSATQLLEEQDAQAWQVTPDSIRWRSSMWSVEQLRQVREHYLIRIGSCSFTEPIRDLEVLGWL